MTAEARLISLFVNHRQTKPFCLLNGIIFKCPMVAGHSDIGVLRYSSMMRFMALKVINAPPQ